jgi:ElaB/YqjD/DUF883 family membrane-anchored ribosome-binding protein
MIDGAAKTVKNESENFEEKAEETFDLVKDEGEDLTNTAATAAGTFETVKDELKNKFGQLGDKATVYKEKVSDNLLTAAEKVHEKSDTAQTYLDQKADSVNEFAHQTIGKANEFGHRAAEALNTSSDYVRNFDFEETRGQLKTSIQKRPEVSIAIAGIFGLMLGLLIGKRAR